MVAGGQRLERIDLFPDPRLVASEGIGHDPGDLRRGVRRGPGVQQERPRPAGQDILDGPGEFTPYGMQDDPSGIRKMIVQPLVPPLQFVARGHDLRRVRTVDPQPVLGGHGRVIAIKPASQPEVLGRTRMRRQAPDVDRVIQNVLRHLPGAVICIRRRGADGRYLPIFVGKISPDFLCTSGPKRAHKGTIGRPTKGQ